MTIPAWTEGRVRSFITSTLRGGFRRWPNKYECLREALVGKKVNELTGRISAHYTCALCNRDVPTSNIQVDHLLPIVDPTVGFESWDKFITNLFCDTSNLQALCKECHAVKTKSENALRKRKTNDSSSGD